MNITDLSIKLRKVKTEITAINAELKIKKTLQMELETNILNEFEILGNGIDQIRTDAGTVSIKSITVGNVTDWDTFYDYIYENKAWHMLERRIANLAYREMLDLDLEVPGVESFEKRSISLTKGKT